MPVPLSIHNIDHWSLLGKEGMLLNMEIQAWLYVCKSCLLLKRKKALTWSSRRSDVESSYFCPECLAAATLKLVSRRPQLQAVDKPGHADSHPEECCGAISPHIPRLCFK